MSKSYANGLKAGKPAESPQYKYKTFENSEEDNRSEKPDLSVGKTEPKTFQLPTIVIDKILTIASIQGQSVKQIVTEALETVINNFEKENGPITPLPRRRFPKK